MNTNCNQLLQSISDLAILSLDADGLITYANPATEAITGYAPGALEGAPLTLFYPDKIIAKDTSEYELSVVRSEGIFTAESFRKRKDGSVFWARVSTTPVYESAAKGTRREPVGYT